MPNKPNKIPMPKAEDLTLPPESAQLEMVVLVVRVFSVSELLQNLEFLAMYFFVLWVILRWHTQRRINRFVLKWKNESSDLSLTVQTVRWLDEMLAPVHSAKEKLEALITRAGRMKVQSGGTD